ncbi:MAG: ferric reductase-like transmembrane domain-containing protein [Saprospiraceae bacterium]|nr:ferric reductase-like transmembrane domain-containing protein [Saprospiraceae bacterium]
MSLDYSPVLWSKRKKKYDWIMAGLMGFYLVLFSVLQLVFYPEITAETLIIRATGTLALLMLHVILTIGPLCRLSPHFLPVLYNRRHLGVGMFLVALVHGVFNVFQFHALGDTNPIVSIFSANENYASYGNFPFQTLGFFALLILFLMAATSHDFWLKNLTPKVWKALHTGVYFAYTLIIFHVLLGSYQGEGNGGMLGLLVAGMAIVIGLHLIAARVNLQEKIAEEKTGDDPFQKVCALSEIEEKRAKAVIINGENIAIFKYDGKLSAVHNLCKHQNGPLGEGKIVDGCITCPWHGYQYLPHNGQSPPPFEEKVKTYDVELRNGEVFVNPIGYMEGEERPPCLINQKNQNVGTNK